MRLLPVRPSDAVLAASAAAAFSGIVLLPLGAALLPALSVPWGASWGTGQAARACAFWGPTAVWAAAAALGAAILGLPVGWAAARGGGALLGAALATAAMPTTLTTIGWIAAAGPQGALVRLPGLHSPAGAAFVWALCFWPVCALGAWAGLSRAGASEEEAGRLFLGPRRSALRVLLPAALPSLAAGAAVAFALMLGDLGVPGSLGVRMGAEEVHAVFLATWDPGLAAMAALPAAAMAAVVAVLLCGTAVPPSLMGPPSPEGARPGASPAVRAAAWAIAGVGIGVPAWGLARWAWEGRGFLRAAALLGREGAGTFLLALAAGSLAAALGFAVAFALRGRRRWFKAAACAAVVAFAAPGTLVGIGVLSLSAAAGWEASPACLLCGVLARVLAPALLLAWAALASLPPSWDESARLFGVPAWRQALWIAMPACTRPLAAAALTAGVFAAGEVAVSTLVAPPGAPLLAPRLFSLIHFGADGIVGAVTLMGIAAAVAAGRVGSLAVRA